MSLNKDMLRRLICAKYLFLKGIDTIDRGGAFSSGHATLNFQDSVEMTLRAIAEYLGCQIREKESFSQIINIIGQKSKKDISGSTAFNQLNKARVNFKHFGLEPRLEDVIKFKDSLEEFYKKEIKKYFDIEYSEISLAILIEHRRIQNYLKEAEKLIGDDKYEKSIFFSAIAFEIYLWRYNKGEIGYRKDPFFKIPDIKMQRWAMNLETQVEKMQSQLNLIMGGINLANYRRFQGCVPHIQISTDGVVMGAVSSGKRIEPTKESALFCYEFVVDSILIMKTNQLPSKYQNISKKHRILVTKVCPIIVFPMEKPEIIRDANIDEVLYGIPASGSHSEYYKICLDGDDAYIKKDCISEAANN